MQQHSPLIRRGTHARVCCIDRTISQFLSLPSSSLQETKKQVVILGAGRDTSFLRHVLSPHEEKCNNNNMNVQWYDIDHPSVMQTKKILMDSSSLVHVTELPSSCETTKDSSSWSLNVSLSSSAATSSEEKSLQTDTSKQNNNNASSLTSSSSAAYHLVGYDLRSSSTALFDTLIADFQLDINVPTLFVLECVQMYLPDSASRSLLAAIPKTCKSTTFVALYDPILLSDPFGRVMERNLTNAGVISSSSSSSDSSLFTNRTLSSQMEKIKTAGFDIVIGCDMMNAYETIVTKEQRQCANRCEMLDEIEEWMLIMRHYCFVVGELLSSKGRTDGCNHGDDETATTTHNTNTDGRENEENNVSCLEKLCTVGNNSPLGFVEGKCSVLYQES